MKNLLITLISLTSLSIYAQDAIALKKDEPAPFAGVLLNNSKAQELYRKSEELKLNKLIMESYDKSLALKESSIKINQDSIDVLLKRNDDLSKQLNSSRSMNNWERIGWFGLGVIISGYGIYVSSKIVR